MFAWTKPACPPPRSLHTLFSNAISNKVDNLSPVDNLKDATTLVLDDTSPAVTSAADTCGAVDRHCVGIVLRILLNFQFELKLVLRMGGYDVLYTHFGLTWLDPHRF